MSCSKGKKHAHVEGSKKSHATLRCYWKKKVLLSTCANALKKKGHWLTMNLTIMIDTTRAQLLK